MDYSRYTIYPRLRNFNQEDLLQVFRDENIIFSNIHFGKDIILEIENKVEIPNQIEIIGSTVSYTHFFYVNITEET